MPQVDIEVAKNWATIQTNIMDICIIFFPRLNGRTISDMRQLGMLQECKIDEILAEDRLTEERERKAEEMEKEKRRRLNEEQKHHEEQRRRRRKKKRQEGREKDRWVRQN